MMLNWFKKERPLLGMTGYGGGAGGLAAGGGTAWTPSGITATGGTKETGITSPDGTPYTYHYFPGSPHGPNSHQPYPFDVTAVTGPGEVEYLLIGGGGVGSNSANPPGTHNGSGGGGAGGMLCNWVGPNALDSRPNFPIRPNTPGTQTATVQDYAFLVGRGGGGKNPTDCNGLTTTAFGYTAYGGGAGAADEGLTVQNGASGGGGAGPGPNPNPNPGEAGEATPGPSAQGTDGGAGGPLGGGGGGGFDDVGGVPSGPWGGEGKAFPETGQPNTGYFMVPNSWGTPATAPVAPTNPNTRWFCGGGGGGRPPSPSFGPPASPTYTNMGSGTLGNSGSDDDNGHNGEFGGNATGGGGGGAGGGSGQSYGGQGGPGLIIVRYID